MFYLECEKRMIGILCGLRSEAKIADRIPNVLVGCSAARPQSARSLARHMAEQGVDRLISFGLAGGVSPDLVAGDLLLGVSVMASKDSCWEADAAWHKSLVEQLPHALCVPVWGSDRIAAKVEDKELIYRRTGCMAVDMESHIVAQVASEYGIPFNIVRSVSDTASMGLPEAAQVPLLDDGTVNRRGVWLSIRKKPMQIPDLARLGIGSFRAMRSLRQVVEVMAELGEG